MFYVIHKTISKKGGEGPRDLDFKRPTCKIDCCQMGIDSSWEKINQNSEICSLLLLLRSKTRAVAAAVGDRIIEEYKNNLF
jgi:hypothetical protein